MKRAVFVCLVLLAQSGLAAEPKPPYESCWGYMSDRQISSHNWLKVRDAKITEVNPGSATITIEQNGKRLTMFVVHDTQLCFNWTPGTFRQMQAGDWVNGLMKKVDGQMVAVALGFWREGDVGYPEGYALTGAPGYVYSPYAPGKPAFKVPPTLPGHLLKCPYTGKMFRMPPTPLQWTHHRTPD